MRYGVSNWIYAGEPLQVTFDRLVRFGYQALELVGEPERLQAGHVLALSRSSGIPVTSILTWCLAGLPGRDLASPDPIERHAAVDYARSCLDFAVAVEAPVLVVLPAPAGRTAPAGNPQTEAEWKRAHATEWGLALESIRALAEHSQGSGILLALEPINRYETFLVTNLEQGLRFLDQAGVPNLKLHLDTFHMNIEEPDPAAAVLQAGDRLVNLHLSDSNRQAPGRGHLDFAALLKALQAIGYQGVLTLEPVPPGSNPLLAAAMSDALPLRDAYAEESIRYLRALEEEAQSER